MALGSDFRLKYGMVGRRLSRKPGWHLLFPTGFITCDMRGGDKRHLAAHVVMVRT
jgi:hypothetical protein